MWYDEHGSALGDGHNLLDIQYPDFEGDLDGPDSIKKMLEFTADYRYVGCLVDTSIEFYFKKREPREGQPDREWIAVFSTDRVKIPGRRRGARLLGVTQ